MSTSADGLHRAEQQLLIAESRAARGRERVWQQEVVVDLLQSPDSAPRQRAILTWMHAVQRTLEQVLERRRRRVLQRRHDELP